MKEKKPPKGLEKSKYVNLLGPGIGGLGPGTIGSGGLGEDGKTEFVGLVLGGSILVLVGEFEGGAIGFEVDTIDGGSSGNGTGAGNDKEGNGTLTNGVGQIIVIGGFVTFAVFAFYSALLIGLGGFVDLPVGGDLLGFIGGDGFGAGGKHAEAGKSHDRLGDCGSHSVL